MLTELCRAFCCHVYMLSGDEAGHDRAASSVPQQLYAQGVISTPVVSRDRGHAMSTAAACHM